MRKIYPGIYIAKDREDVLNYDPKMNFIHKIPKQSTPSVCPECGWRGDMCMCIKLPIDN